jgi:hypothetical protein
VPPRAGLIEHVVVDQRRGVNHLHNGGEQMMGRRHLATGVRHQQQ